MKRQIRVYERDRIYPQSISFYLELLKKSPRERRYVANYWEVMGFGDAFFWARDVNYLEKAFRAWFKEWVDNPAKRKIFFNAFANIHRRSVKELKAAQKIDVSRLSNKEMSSLRQKIIALITEHLYYSEYPVDLFDDYFGLLFQEYLKEKLKIKLLPKDLTELIRPTTVSSIIKYQAELLKMSSARNITDGEVKKIIKKYGWIKMSWDGSNELTGEIVKKEIGDIERTSASERRRKLEDYRKYSKEARKGRYKILKKNKISLKSVAVYFELLDKFNLFHDYRKEAQMRPGQILYRMLLEISRRFGIPYDDLLYYKNEEIDSLLKENKLIGKKLLTERRLGFVLYIKKGKIQEYVGVKANTIAKKLVWDKVNADLKKEIKGLPASRGTARGSAYVTKSAKEANEFLKPGQILVTSMTLPDFLPAMKRAAAIVTDDGGATCHAAMISREFGIPCVVGTKVATRVIKNGDIIEVRADYGIIKIIKKLI